MVLENLIKIIHVKTKLIIIVLFGICPIHPVSAQDSIYHRAKIWDKTIEKFLQEDKTVTNRKNPVLFIGSSSFTRWTEIQKDFPEHNVLNRGFGASVTSDLIYYADKIIFPYKPSQIVIYEGDNDVGSGMPVDDFIDDIKTLVRLIELKLPGVPVLILSVKPSPRRDKSRAGYQEANIKLHQFASARKHVTFVDVSTLMVDQQGNYRYDLYASDSLHINKKAYKRWAERIRPHLVK